jgi:TRAP-type uncharacterized transport system fused permease subunit
MWKPLPTVAAYLVANILFVPSLIRLGIDPLPANMFVFYFGIIAQITPPVCLASYTAAGIAGAESMKTGITGFLYATVAFTVPFIFIYQPGILLIGSIQEIIIGTIILFIGVFFLASAIGGFLVIELKPIPRVLLFGAALLIIIPEIITDIIGFGLGFLMLIYNLVISRKAKNKEVV